MFSCPFVPNAHLRLLCNFETSSNGVTNVGHFHVRRTVTDWLGRNGSALLPRAAINWFGITTGHLMAFNRPFMADQRDPEHCNGRKTLNNGLAVATTLGNFRQLTVKEQARWCHNRSQIHGIEKTCDHNHAYQIWAKMRHQNAAFRVRTHPYVM